MRHLLALRFVTRGELPAWVETAFAQLETERDLADYTTGYLVPPERYEERRAACDRLLETLEEHLRQGGWL